jgi:hypothetical protein
MAVPSFRICSTSLAALLHIAIRKRNYRAELTVLSVGRFAGFGAGHVTLNHILVTYPPLNAKRVVVGACPCTR